MSPTNEMVEEMELLTLYDLSNPQEGLKVHANAKPGAIAAAERLYQKGLLTQVDGGYLTRLGQDAAEHAQALLTILTGD